ncbi:MAG TPA: aldo/keto reductase [Thermomicrobiales bacterium]|nr:aldo/keto reductase [Thermomicrobiales bacterium]
MIPTLPFGRTGHVSTRIIFGAAALSAVTQAEADSTMELIIRHGINHIDTAASYGDAELRLGPWMETHRKDFFLATKTGEREFQPAYDQIRRSLERLRTDQVDLIQLHNLVDQSEWDIAMGPGGALEAAVRAREEGLVRFIGVTGHGLAVAERHRQSLERFDFDSILLPYNYPMMRNPQYAADFEAVVALCQERNVAVQTIKAITKAPWGDQPQTAATWYEPLRDQGAIDVAVSWVLGREGVFLNTVGDIHVLPMVLDAAERFTTRPSDQEMHGLASQWQMEPLFTTATA